MSMLGVVSPVSQRLTAWRVTNTFAASSSCVMPFSLRIWGKTSLIAIARPPSCSTSLSIRVGSKSVTQQGVALSQAVPPGLSWWVQVY